tara:strand:- start:1115 stop:2296 length:1182 start_codon:yes stop_codon:yes gene_type:complete
MTRIRVVQITTRLNVGGIAHQVIGVCEGLDPERFECTLITGRPGRFESQMLDYVDRQPGRLHFIPELGRDVFWRDLPAFLKLVRLLRRLRPDVVHTHAAKAGALGRLAAWAARVPVRVHSYHGHVFRGYFHPIAEALIVQIERWLGYLTSMVLLPSESQRDEIVVDFRIVPAEKTRVVRYGISVDEASTLPDQREVRRRFRLDAPLVVGMLGRMAPIKNHALTVDAFARLQSREDVPDVQLLLAGEGETRAELERQVADLRIGDRVRFQGFQRDLRDVYAALDVLVISSRNEGVPIAALEAMAAGVPLVVTAVGGLVDLIRDGENGWLTPLDDPNRLAEVLHQALVLPAERSRVAEAARRDVQARYRADAIHLELEQLYRDALTRAGARNPES